MAAVAAGPWAALDGLGQFADYEIADLSAIFASLAEDGGSHVRVDALSAALATCPIAERFLEQAAKGTDLLSAEAVVLALGPCGANASAVQKLRALFSAYDLDGDGKIGTDDAFSMLKLLQGQVFIDDILRAQAKEVAGEDGMSFDAFAAQFGVEDTLFGLQLGVLPIVATRPRTESEPRLDAVDSQSRASGVALSRVAPSGTADGARSTLAQRSE
jgi:Ca2+-binding EF-hand superfamily protein